jgi:hypothetical protein
MQSAHPLFDSPAKINDMSYKRVFHDDHIYANWAGVVLWRCPLCHHINKGRRNWHSWSLHCKGCGKKYMVGLSFKTIARGAAAHGPHVPDDGILPVTRDAQGIWRRFDTNNDAEPTADPVTAATAATGATAEHVIP